MGVKEATIELHQGDIPEGLDFGNSVAVDTETMGLNPQRDRLCLMQLSAGDGMCHLVQFKRGVFVAPNIKALLEDQSVTKIFHYARFDLMMIRRYLGATCQPVFCTKIASKLIRTYTSSHGLKDLCRELLGVELVKEQQSSDWGQADLTQEQIRYAAHDVLYLHELRVILDEMLAREGRSELAYACFKFVNSRADLDLGGWLDQNIFAH
ncbi:MAG: ribonuclease D [Rhodospirillales bacterium]